MSVRADDKESRGGGSRRYLPPDFDPEVIPHNGERADRDLYALGLTLYEALTWRYPWDTTEPPINKPAPDPREFSGFADLAPELVSVVLKAIAPRRAERYHAAADFRDALAEVRHARRIQTSAWRPCRRLPAVDKSLWRSQSQTAMPSSHICSRSTARAAAAMPARAA